MKAVLLAAVISLVVALFGTPMFIKFLVRRGYGQFIRDDGPTSHHTKRGTPTMGGAVIIGSSIAAYGLAHAVTGTPLTWSGVLVLFLMAGLGLVGFLDDYIKITKQRSLGLRSRAEARRADPRRGRVRRAGAAVPQRQDRTPGLDPHLVRPGHPDRPGLRRVAGRADPLHHLGQHHDRRHLQRGEPHRRSRRTGHRGVA